MAKYRCDACENRCEIETELYFPIMCVINLVDALDGKDIANWEKVEDDE